MARVDGAIDQLQGRDVAPFVDKSHVKGLELNLSD
jgi:hypothetical protein